MHPDIERLLDLQQKDLALLEVDTRLRRLHDEVAGLDDSVAQARDGVDQARRATQVATKRRAELEAKVEGLGVLQDRRRQRLELAKTQRELQALTNELELARSVLAKEEAEWFRASEQANALQQQVEAAERALAEHQAAQDGTRDELAKRIAEVEAEREVVKAEREASAAAVTPALRLRYDRLRRARQNEVVVAIQGDSCGSCFTAVPMSRRSHIRAGMLIEACEACGVLLYATVGEFAHGE